ncbi:hypothetical protein OPV22_014736 [Ensete ventricosum]|uniref:Uncharacterized protein n=1 Tax=Ensete ventricosum TaxID=4639 RepID=A0AAV8RBC2_ENSVE|nr:hypothetical protein OPV22_014736 [Ensete ventricosum]
MLDTTVKDWPVEETLRFAKLALKCAKLRRKDLQDLGTMMQPKFRIYFSLLRQWSLHQIQGTETTPSTPSVSVGAFSCATEMEGGWLDVAVMVSGAREATLRDP